MAINFPDNPSVNDEFTADTGRTWVWTGSTWKSKTVNLDQYVSDTTNIHGISDTANLAYLSDLSSKQDTVVGVSSTEIGYLENVTSDIQDQLDNKAGTSHDHVLANITDVTASAAEVNVLSGITADVNELNILDGVTATASELNILDGATVTTVELNFVSGATSSIQDQLSLKSDTSHTHIIGNITDITATSSEINTLSGITADVNELNTLDGITANVSELNILDGATITTAELNYVSGVTSSIQDQLSNKASSSHSHDDLYYTESEIDNLLNDKSDASHTHVLTDITDVSASSTEVNYLSGVTSSVQDQLDDKAPIADPTFTGTATTTYAHITPTSTKPATWSEGNLYYDSEEKTLILQGSGTTFEMSMGQREWVRCRNGSASTIYKGQPVYGYGVHIPGDPVHGHHILVDLADASDIDKKNVIGLAGEDIAAGTHGYVVTRGYLEGVDTSNLTSGHRVHLGFASPGTLVEISPTYPNYPMDVGICLTSDATNGTLYIEMSHHSFERIRVENNAYVDGNLTVGGDFTLLGSQSSIELVNLQVQNSFVYLNSGDTIGASNTTFSGSGLNDAVFTGHYEGTASNKTFKVKINGAGTGTGGVDTFIWSTDDFSTSSSTIDVSTSPIALEDGIYVDFVAAIGHTVDDVWSGTVSPVNVDSGWFANRNTGTSGVGYTHMGVFYDISDEKFKFVNEYSPEPSGTIDTGDLSYASGIVVASSFEGDLTGDVTGSLLNGINAIDGVSVGTAATGDVLYHDGSSWINKYINAIPAKAEEVTLTSNNYSLASGDEGMILEVNNSAAAATVTIPSSEAFTVGSMIVILQTGDGGDVTVQVENSGTQTLNSSPGAILRGQWSAATLLKRGTNLWVVYGDLKA